MKTKKPSLPAARPLQNSMPVHRPLDLDCWFGDGQEHHQGALISIRAVFNPIGCHVEIMAISEDYRFAKLRLDHAQTRAVLLSFNGSLSDLARLRDRISRAADFGELRQFNASRYKSANGSPAGIQIKAMPARKVVLIAAQSSAGGFYSSIRLYLTTLEAEALTFDLERALRDMEQFTDLGL
jgi:hypothetical protein